ncbi:MAG: YqeG family HAD IIIA-type phosphatase [Bacilli bacterium]
MENGKVNNEVKNVLKVFLPNLCVENVTDITVDYLKANGIKTVITDLDNTLIAWDKPHATDELIAWFSALEEAGFSLIIVSNNNEERVRVFAEPHNIPFIHKARKPLATAYRKAIQQMGVEENEVVMVGDQLLTDIFGANRLGIHSILVKPVVQTDGIPTRVNRFFERRILRKLKKQGHLK